MQQKILIASAVLLSVFFVLILIGIGQYFGWTIDGVAKAQGILFPRERLTHIAWPPSDKSHYTCPPGYEPRWFEISGSNFPVGDSPNQSGWFECANDGFIPQTQFRPPSQPSNLFVRCDNGTATFSWNPASDWGVPSTNQRYAFRLRDNITGVEWAYDVSTPGTGMGPGMGGASYSWWVHAVSDGGWSAASHGQNFDCLPKPLSPIGSFDSATCGYGPGVLTGWACDPNNYDAPLTIQIFSGAPLGQPGSEWVGSTVANRTRADVSGQCGGRTNRGFEFSLPPQLRDGVNRTYYVYAIDDGSLGVAPSPSLDSPRATQCIPIPSAPTLLNAGCYNDGSNVTGTAVLNWQPQTFATQYALRVQRNGAPSTFGNCSAGYLSPSAGLWCWDNVGTSQTIYNIPLDSRKSYTWWVHAVNPAGWSAETVATAAQEFVCPTAAPDLTVTANPTVLDPGNFNLAISWDSERSESCRAVRPASLNVTGFDGTDTDVVEPPPGRSETYEVQCENIGGPTTRSVTVSTRAINTNISLVAEAQLIPRGGEARLTTQITTNYNLDCTLVGGGANINIPVPAGPNVQTQTHQVGPINNATNFTLSCLPRGYSNADAEIRTLRIEVVPAMEEI